MRPVSVLHIIRSHSWGGLEIYVTQFIKNMVQTDIPQAVFCLEGSLIHKELQSLNIPIFTTDKPAKFSWKDIQLLKQLSHQFSIFHSHTNKDVWPASLARLFGAKSNHVFSLYMGVTNKRDFWHKIIYGKVDALVSSSIKINNEVAENYPIAKEKIHLVRYGRDVKTYVSDEIKRNEIRAKYHANPETVVLGTLARIDEGKGVWELAESAMYLPEALKSKVQIWIIGDRSIVGSGPDGKPVYERKSEELYEKLVSFIEANQLSNTVKLIGFQKDYISYLGAMDVFTLLSWDEMYSLSVIDSMFMALPTIGTNAGGTPEQTGTDRGVLVPIKSPKDVANQLTLLALNPQLRHDLGHKAKTWVLEQHSWENVLRRFKELYGGILKQN